MSKLSFKYPRKIGLIAESDLVTDFGNGSGILFEQIRAWE